jgi:DNA modification methylase
MNTPITTTRWCDGSADYRGHVRRFDIGNPHLMLLHGDCLDVLATLPDNSVDSVVTDPPYGLSFMGKRWDYDVPSEAIWRECLRVLKPGGHLLAFAGTRTQHRMAVRIEDAGFEIRDMIAWVYGSGFPKSHNGPWGGTALKPALEPITVARKPLDGTVAANVLAHGTGGLNIDGCRVGTTREVPASHSKAHSAVGATGISGKRLESELNPNIGRWPANLIHDGSEEVLAGFPQTGGGGKPQQTEFKRSNVQIINSSSRADYTPYNDTLNGGGSAARFFYCAKASKKDRDDNNHPTVKPTDLMRYLCRLVTPTGGTVLDPFMGSGSTGKAARLEGFQFIGIERDPDYFAIAQRRIADAQSQERMAV